MNHSCCPSVIVTYKGTLAEVTVQDISPGKVFFTSCIDLLIQEDKNGWLRDSLFFTCWCQECTTKDKDKAKVEIQKLSDSPKGRNYPCHGQICMQCHGGVLEGQALQIP